MRNRNLRFGILLVGALFGCVSRPPIAATETAAKDWQRYNDQGQTAMTKGELFEAARLFDLAAKQAEQFGPEDSRLPSTLIRLGNARWGLGKYEEAEEPFRRALALDEKRLGSNNLQVARDLCSVARACGSTQKSAEAETLYIRAQSIVALKFGPFDRAVGVVLLKRANLYVNEDRLPEAETLYQEALHDIESDRVRVHFTVNRQATRNILPADLAEVAAAQADLGVLYLREKKYHEAESSLRDSLQTHEYAYGRNSGALISVLDNLALVNLDQKRFADAEPLLRRALHIMDASVPTHPLRVRTELMLDQSLTGQGKPAEKVAPVKPEIRN